MAHIRSYVCEANFKLFDFANLPHFLEFENNILNPTYVPANSNSRIVRGGLGLEEYVGPSFARHPAAARRRKKNHHEHDHDGHGDVNHWYHLYASTVLFPTRKGSEK